ncbi:hypothetical protein WA026_008532 [Henosepilachna vigintioctopunctata]|uniref:Farnesyl pyrophosphate synthase n=1 Tax=Henosepilachna vigintioctopunctata TaxID=420089 RepID=A0AAW1U8E6_9CUCU
MFRITVGKVEGFSKILGSIRSFSEFKIPKKDSFGIISKNDAANFLAYFPNIVNDVVDHHLVSSFPEVNERIKRVLYFNVPYGSHVTPHLLIYCHKFIEEYENTFDVEKQNNSFRMAWCLDIMNAMTLIFDDILDDSELRRGKKTWYKLEGPQAVCDGLLLQSCYLRLLDKYFSHEKKYEEMVNTIFKSEIDAVSGETLQFEVKNIESFTIENYRNIAKSKSTPIRFYAPLNGDIILKELGILYQIQNDYYDFYGEKLIGKVGNDIQNNTCTILIATALEKGSEEQKKTLIECYGQNEPDKVRKVKDIYSELKLENEYNKLEDRSRRLICTELMKIENQFTRDLMKNYSSLIFRSFKNDILNCT